MKQEQIIQIQLMDQEVNHLNEQLKIVEQNISEMNELIKSLNEIEKEDDILANLGKRIYIPVKIKEKELIVDVGKGILIRKAIPETKELIKEQVGKLIEGKNQIMERLEILQKEMERLIGVVESEQEN